MARSYKCHACSKSYTSLEALGKHVLEMHSKAQGKMCRKKTFFKEEDALEFLNKLEYTHLKIYRCRHCHNLHLTSTGKGTKPEDLLNETSHTRNA